MQPFMTATQPFMTATQPFMAAVLSFMTATLSFMAAAHLFTQSAHPLTAACVLPGAAVLHPHPRYPPRPPTGTTKNTTRSVLRAPYGKTSTDARRYPVLTRGTQRIVLRVVCLPACYMMLRACYGMPGTDAAYGVLPVLWVRGGRRECCLRHRCGRRRWAAVYGGSAAVYGGSAAVLGCDAAVYGYIGAVCGCRAAVNGDIGAGYVGVGAVYGGSAVFMVAVMLFMEAMLLILEIQPSMAAVLLAAVYGGSAANYGCSAAVQRGGGTGEAPVQAGTECIYSDDAKNNGGDADNDGDEIDNNGGEADNNGGGRRSPRRSRRETLALVPPYALTTACPVLT
eukprot:2015880-Rhodomonas_salina.2